MTCNEPFGFFFLSTVGFVPTGLMRITRIIRIHKYYIKRTVPFFFQIAVDVYTDLRYNADEWE